MQPTSYSETPLFFHYVFPSEEQGEFEGTESQQGEREALLKETSTLFDQIPSLDHSFSPENVPSDSTLNSLLHWNAEKLSADDLKVCENRKKLIQNLGAQFKRHILQGHPLDVACKISRYKDVFGLDLPERLNDLMQKIVFSFACSRQLRRSSKVVNEIFLAFCKWAAIQVVENMKKRLEKEDLSYSAPLQRAKEIQLTRFEEFINKEKAGFKASLCSSALPWIKKVVGRTKFVLSLIPKFFAKSMMETPFTTVLSIMDVVTGSLSALCRTIKIISAHQESVQIEKQHTERNLQQVAQPQTSLSEDQMRDIRAQNAISIGYKNLSNGVYLLQKKDRAALMRYYIISLVYKIISLSTTIIGLTTLIAPPVMATFSCCLFPVSLSILIYYYLSGFLRTPHAMAAKYCTLDGWKNQFRSLYLAYKDVRRSSVLLERVKIEEDLNPIGYKIAMLEKLKNEGVQNVSQNMFLILGLSSFGEEHAIDPLLGRLKESAQTLSKKYKALSAYIIADDVATHDSRKLFAKWKQKLQEAKEKDFFRNLKGIAGWERIEESFITYTEGIADLIVDSEERGFRILKAARGVPSIEKFEEKIHRILVKHQADVQKTRQQEKELTGKQAQVREEKKQLDLKLYNLQEERRACESDGAIQSKDPSILQTEEFCRMAYEDAQAGITRLQDQLREVHKAKLKAYTPLLKILRRALTPSV